MDNLTFEQIMYKNKEEGDDITFYREIFFEFAKIQHSEENLEFCAEVNKYRKNPLPKKRKHIIENFVDKNALIYINISAADRKKFEEDIAENPENPKLFDMLYESVTQLIREDIFTRFIGELRENSDHYKKLLDAWRTEQRRQVPILQQFKRRSAQIVRSLSPTNSTKTSPSTSPRSSAVVTFLPKGVPRKSFLQSFRSFFRRSPRVSPYTSPSTSPRESSVNTPKKLHTIL